VIRWILKPRLNLLDCTLIAGFPVLVIAAGIWLALGAVFVGLFLSTVLEQRYWGSK